MSLHSCLSSPLLDEGEKKGLSHPAFTTLSSPLRRVEVLPPFHIEERKDRLGGRETLGLED